MKMLVLTAAALATFASGAALAASEGGDTWSSLQAVRETSNRHVTQSRPARPDTESTSLAGGSEGGDTWSRFVPGFQGQPTGAESLAERLGRQ